MLLGVIFVATKLFAMPQYDLNPAGVADKLAELYALSDPDLNAEADALKADLPAWLNHNFTLTGAQTAYIHTMNPDLMAYLSERLSFCMRYRLLIDLSQQPPSPGFSKILETEDKSKTKTTSQGFAVSGSFHVSIRYES